MRAQLTAWAFAIVCVFLCLSRVPPTTAQTVISARLPADEATVTVPLTAIQLLYNDTFTLGSGNVTLHDLNLGTDVVYDTGHPDFNAIGGGSEVVITSPSVDAGRGYYILVSPGLVTGDSDLLPSVGITSPTGWTFTTNGVFAVAVDTLTPADDESDVFATSLTQLQIDFNQNVFRGTAGSLQLIGGGDTFSFAFDDTTNVAVSDRTVTISLTSVALKGGTNYHVTIPNTFLVSAVDLAFDGWTDSTSWNFSTFCKFLSSRDHNVFFNFFFIFIIIFVLIHF